MKLDTIELSDCHSYLATVSDDSVDLIVIDPPYNELPKDWDSFNDWDFLKNQFDRVLKKSGQLYIFGKQPMMLLTSCPINLKAKETIWRVVEIYLTRWKCNESFRYIKQCHNLEDIRYGAT